MSPKFGVYRLLLWSEFQFVTTLLARRLANIYLSIKSHRIQKNVYVYISDGKERITERKER
jgi:hypothetical protein